MQVRTYINKQKSKYIGFVEEILTYISGQVTLLILLSTYIIIDVIQLFRNTISLILFGRKIHYLAKYIYRMSCSKEVDLESRH